MKPGAEDDYEEEGLFGDYTFDITIRVDDHAKGVRITYPKDLITAQTGGGTGKRNGSDISLRFARKFKDFVTEGGGQIISQNKKYVGFQEKDEMLNAYTISDIRDADGETHDATQRQRLSERQKAQASHSIYIDHRESE